jgi:hypothetical protein
LQSNLGNGFLSIGALVAGGSIHIGYGKWDPDIKIPPEWAFSIESLVPSVWSGYHRFYFGSFNSRTSQGWRLRFPIWLPGGVFATIAILGRRRKLPADCCRRCGHVRVSPLCPECGDDQLPPKTDPTTSNKS